MQPLVIIDFFDEERKPDFDIRKSLVFPEIDLFGFQGLDESPGSPGGIRSQRTPR
jgi:hypothetical protein